MPPMSRTPSLRLPPSFFPVHHLQGHLGSLCACTVGTVSLVLPAICSCLSSSCRHYIPCVWLTARYLCCSRHQSGRPHPSSLFLIFQQNPADFRIIVTASPRTVSHYIDFATHIHMKIKSKIDAFNAIRAQSPTKVLFFFFFFLSFLLFFFFSLFSLFFLLFFFFFFFLLFLSSFLLLFLSFFYFDVT